MGGTVSRGVDNQSLIDELINSGTTLTSELERAMRLVDRGDYAQEKSQRVYMDLAWRSKTLHLSAPSIYAVALQNLDIEPGLHFLNIGSGTGYLSTIIGLLLGESGVNHGLEVEKLNVIYARERLTAFLKECDAPFERPFCTPYFMQGNILDLVAPPVELNNSSPLVNENTSSAQEDASVSILITLINPSISPSRGSTLGAFFSTSQSTRASHSPVIENSNENPLNRVTEAEGISSATVRIPTAEMNEESEASGLDENDDDDADDLEEEDYEDDVHTYHSILRDGHCTIAPPPVLAATPESVHVDADSSLPRWPLYDRIYVGAAVIERSHLEAILRLLKVGGVMVAPVRDKFLKIKRTSENSISITELMSVSFATLIVPPTDSTHVIETPPPREVASLEQTCARFIRAKLKQVIEIRHNGLPTLGRLQEIKTNVDEIITTGTDTKPNQHNDHNKNTKNKKVESSDDSPTKPCDDIDCPDTNQSTSRVNSMTSFINTIEDEDVTNDRSTNPETSTTPSVHTFFGNYITHLPSDKDDDEPASSNVNRNSTDPESQGTSPKRQKSQYHWVGPSYTYKEEMSKILAEELHFTAFLARSVMTL